MTKTWSMQDVVCGKCGIPIRDGFCGLSCDGQAEGITVTVTGSRPMPEQPSKRLDSKEDSML